MLRQRLNSLLAVALTNRLSTKSSASFQSIFAAALVILSLTCANSRPVTTGKGASELPPATPVFIFFCASSAVSGSDRITAPLDLQALKLFLLSTAGAWLLVSKMVEAGDIWSNKMCPFRHNTVSTADSISDEFLFDFFDINLLLEAYSNKDINYGREELCFSQIEESCLQQ